MTDTPRWKSIGSTSILVLVVGFLLLRMIPPRGRIADESNTAECRGDLEGALESFADRLGLDYYVDSDDAQTLIDEGRLQKEYAGLGVLYVAHFGLVSNRKGCHLKFYKREKRQPGQWGSSLGSWGTVQLERCLCS